MNVLELFAGTGSFSNVVRSNGHTAFLSDYDNTFDVDYVVDILEFDLSRLPSKPDIIWASPPCETFSVASLGHHWTGGKGAYIPKTDSAIQGQEYVKKAIAIIKELKPKYWVIENPRGMLRKMPFMQEFEQYRHTVIYCQYGDTRMKPTDIWTNIPWTPRVMCKNGMPCHVSAPRGSSTGTQGIKTYKDRSRVPNELCQELLDSISVIV